MEKILILMLQARTLAHSYHLKSHSLAQHEALGDLYSSLSDHIDTLAEVYQGFTERLLALDSFPAFVVQGDPVDQLREIANAIETMRTQVSPTNSTIENLVDEVMAMIYKIKYRMIFLK